jgi:hypothetical protein
MITSSSMNHDLQEIQIEERENESGEQQEDESEAETRVAAFSTGTWQPLISLCNGMSVMNTNLMKIRFSAPF